MAGPDRLEKFIVYVYGGIVKFHFGPGTGRIRDPALVWRVALAAPARRHGAYALRRGCAAARAWQRARGSCKNYFAEKRKFGRRARRSTVR
jgi:hypothetical protein